MARLRAEYLTTGEAAQILGISRSSAARRFDAGTLWGKTNVLTGERMIHRDSVRQLMQAHDLSEDTGAVGLDRSVLTVGDTLGWGVPAADGHDITVGSTEYGADALLACGAGEVDLLVLGAAIGDISKPDLVTALRRRDLPVKVLCLCRTASDRDACLRAGAEAAVTEAELRPGRVTELTASLLGLESAVVLDDNACVHRRRWERVPVDFPARTGIYRLSRPRQHLWGEARVRNISEGGALLDNIAIEGGLIPGAPFRVLLDIHEAPLGDFRAYCRVVRLSANGSLRAGVEFLRLAADDREKLTALIAGS